MYLEMFTTKSKNCWIHQGVKYTIYKIYSAYIQLYWGMNMNPVDRVNYNTDILINTKFSDTNLRDKLLQTQK